MNETYHIASMGLTSQSSTLSIKGVAEIQNGFFTPIAWVGMLEGSGGAKVSMLFRPLDLRALSIACRELIREGRSDYRKHTNPSLAGGSGDKKMLALIQKDGKYYINISNGSKNFGYQFDRYALAGFSDSLKLLTDELEKTTYLYQRKAETNLKRQQGATQ